MWKLFRQTVSSKWNLSRQQTKRKPIIEIANINENIPLIQNVLYRNINVKIENNFGENEGKEKKKSKYRERSYIEQPPSFIERVTWLGTSFALALNLKLKFCPPHYHEDNKVLKNCFQHGLCTRFSSLWTDFVFSMPIFKKCTLPESTESKLLTSSADKVLDTEEVFTNEEINNEMKDASKKYVGHTQNIIGLQLLEEDPSHAFLHFEKAGKLGCSKANFNLGVCFETGNGTERDLEKAAHYYKLAASEGHGLASYNLGIYYLEGMGGLEKDENTGIELIEKAAEQNIVEAQVFLGIHYFQCDKRCKAFKYFEKAAKTSTDGQYYLGLCFENGWGTNIDNHQAAKLFSSAAASGHLEAIFSIASYYEKGLGGIEQDIDFAISLYELAVNAGHKEAEYCLEKLRSSKLSKPTKVKSCDIKRENYECHNIHVSSSSPELSRIGSPVESNFLMDIADCFKDNSQAFWRKVPRKSNFWIDSEVNCSFDAEKELPHWTSTPTLLSVI